MKRSPHKEVPDTDMNKFEKKSFYSFLVLYVVSSFFFLALTAFWYYTAQKNAIENETFYRLEHIADHKAGEIIVSHMQQRGMKYEKLPDDISLALIDTDGKLKEGRLVSPDIPLKRGYFKKGNYNILVSDAPREHLNIRYVVVQTDMEAKQIAALQKFMMGMVVIAAILIVLIAWVLSKLFIQPIQQHVKQIERFINDVTHELNTPISSLNMATDQALKNGVCTTKTLKNISISTRQLYDIYRSLTYLNFDNVVKTNEIIDVEEVMRKSIEYYSPLAEIKQIVFNIDLESFKYPIPASQATLLFGNLIGNAIKYSSRKSKIEITLKERVLTIRDEGIGIAPEKMKEVFERFKRGTEYSGGFGVGLNIVKSICERYDIRIEVDSVPKEGTEFRLYFP